MAVKCWDKMDADRAEMKGEVGQRALLVGAGGTAKAAMYALRSACAPCGPMWCV